MHHHWTPSETEQVRRRYPVEGPHKLAYELGVSRQAVIGQARLLGVRTSEELRKRTRRAWGRFRV